MSVAITIENAVKKYGDKTVIPDLNLKINSGEFFTLLGPSGCGKTTLLRMIAGFNTIEGGKFFFNDTCINDMDPGKRNIGMVFQNYAIFPHMTVRNNVAFGLKNRKVDKATIERETDKFLKLVHIEGYADKKPDELSGGQQQRVALARALVVQPDVLLMDEPLSNLDAKLRVDMRAAIKRLQHDAGITTVYVTHDQEEAMAVSDRIAVMKDGVIQHVGRPQNIYQRPSNIFVSSFIGKSNQMKAKLRGENGKAVVRFDSGYEIGLDSIRPECVPGSGERDVFVMARPEELLIQKKELSGAEGFKVTIEDSVFLGLNTHYFVRLEDGTEAEVIQESQIEKILEPGENLFLTVNTRKVNVFDAGTGLSLMTGIEDDTER